MCIIHAHIGNQESMCHNKSIHKSTFTDEPRSRTSLGKNLLIKRLLWEGTDVLCQLHKSLWKCQPKVTADWLLSRLAIYLLKIKLHLSLHEAFPHLQSWNISLCVCGVTSKCFCTITLSLVKCEIKIKVFHCVSLPAVCLATSALRRKHRPPLYTLPWPTWKPGDRHVQVGCAYRKAPLKRSLREVYQTKLTF